MAFVRACALSELAENTALAIEVDGTDVAVVCSGGNYYAIADECSHAAIPLSEGDVEDGEIECYLHGSRFDLASGKPLGLPATEPVAVYPVTVDGDDLLVDVTTTNN
jgi:3-phenylpropionate/trans-cinnamate dioxygenase ferredoxin subunit